MQVQSWRQSWSFSLPRCQRNGLPHVGKVSEAELHRCGVPWKWEEASRRGRRKQGLGIWGKEYWLRSQFCPAHPRKQLQWYPPIKFLQERAFTQGFPAHSFASERRQHVKGVHQFKNQAQGDTKRPKSPPSKHRNTGSGTFWSCWIVVDAMLDLSEKCLLKMILLITFVLYCILKGIQLKLILTASWFVMSVIIWFSFLGSVGSRVAWVVQGSKSFI